MKLVERLHNGYAYYGPYADAVEAAWKDANDEMLFHSHDLPTDIPLYAPKGLK